MHNSSLWPIPYNLISNYMQFFTSNGFLAILCKIVLEKESEPLLELLGQNPMQLMAELNKESY